jgi:hypothetical protein
METTIRETLQGRIDELKTLRDEIRVDLRLAGMDLRDEWMKLEKRLPDTRQLASDIKRLTVEALDDLMAEVRRFRSTLAERCRDQGNARAANEKDPTGPAGHPDRR